MSIFEELNQLVLFDFRVDSLTTSLDGDDVLTVHGSRDFSYYRNASHRGKWRIRERGASTWWPPS
jgi:hypothetical protein